jgi:hypothetical protein
VRVHGLTLAARLKALGVESQVPDYILRLCERDPELDIRDRAMLFLAILDSQNDAIKSAVGRIFFPDVQAPAWAKIEAAPPFQIGTISQYFGRMMPGYEPLPDWAEEGERPPDSVRLPVKRINGKEFVVGLDDTSPGLDEEVASMDDFFGDSDEDQKAEEDEEEAEDGDENEAEDPDDRPVAQKREEKAQKEEEEEDEDLDNFFD